MSIHRLTAGPLAAGAAAVLAFLSPLSIAERPMPDAPLYNVPMRQAERLRSATEEVAESYADRALAVPTLDEADAAAFSLDGRLDEAFWGRAARAGGFVTIYDALPSPVETEALLARDREHLYIGLRCLHPPDVGAQGSDLVRVILSPADSGGRFAHLSLRADGRMETFAQPEVPWRAAGVIRRILNSVQAVEVDWEAAVHVGDDAWTAEIRVPLTLMDRTPLSNHDLGINVIRDRIGGYPVSSWFPLRRAYPDWGVNGAFFVHHARMGDLFFCEDPGDVLSLPKGEWRFAYLSPTEKELSFVIPPEATTGVTGADIMGLMDPSGKIHEDSIVVHEASLENGRAAFRFSHPLPGREGRYVLGVFMEYRDRGGRDIFIHFDRESLLRAGVGANRELLAAARAPEHVRPAEIAPPSDEVRHLLGMVPRHSGFRMCPSPASDIPEGGGRFDWDPGQPNRIVCRESGEAFPDNEKHPVAGVQRWRNPMGEVVEYEYVLTPNGDRAYIHAHICYHQRNHIVNSVEDLAGRDPVGAARVLLKLAEVYPGYGPTYDHRWGPVQVYETVGPPYPQSTSGIWASWPNSSELRQVAKMARALAAIRQTDALAQMSAEAGEDLDAKIEYGLVRASTEHIKSFAINNHNIDGSTWQGMIELANALGEPDYVHDVIDRLQAFMAHEFFMDGFFNEITVCYHRQTTRNMVTRIDRALDGWEDPEGYVSPRNGRRTEGFQVAKDVVEQFPVVGRALAVPNALVYPNRRFLPVQDTWAYNMGHAPERSEPLLLPGAKIARLGRGEGGAQTQAYLMFHPKYTGHIHQDALNVAFFTLGLEMLPDLGYDRSHIRYWSQSSLAQNMVVVNAQDMTSADAQAGGNVEVFAPVSDGLQIVRAHQENAYAGIVDLYVRELWLVARPDGSEYLVDVFRVSGGERHEYTFQGEARHDSQFATSLATEEYGPYLLPPGVVPREPTSMAERGDAGGHYEPYLFVRDVRRAALPDGRYDLTVNTKEVNVRPVPTGVEVVEKGTPLPGMRITGFSGPGDGGELFLGKAPSLRPVRFSRATGHRRYAQNRSEMMNHWMPKMVLRREGKDLKSTFSAVMEPFRPEDGEPESVVSRMENLPEGVTGLTVEYGPYRDTLLSALEAPEEPWRIGDIEFSGKMGFVRERDGQVVAMALVGGGTLRRGGDAVEAAGPVSGAVLGTLRREAGDAFDGLVVDADVPAGMAGRHVVVTHPCGLAHGFRVEEVLRHEGRTALRLDYDPGFELLPAGASAKTFFPFTHWEGQGHAFRIENVAVR